MAGQRKRKHATVDENQTQPAIQNFGTIGKSHVSDTRMKKRKTVHQKDPTPPPARQPSVDRSDKKRKRGLETIDEDAQDEDSIFKEAKQNPMLKQLVQDNARTPRAKRTKVYQPPSPVETPSKDATDLFNKMRLSAAATPIPFSFGSKDQAYDTPPDTPPANVYEPDQLPAELEDMLKLHAAFLSALSLYYAHNGTASPVSVKALLPMVTKNWRKRAVSLDDLQTLLAVSLGEASFILKDFGKGGICLTKAEPRGRGIKRAASFVDEVDLNSQFEEALQKRWREWLLATPKENHDIAVFMDQLPLAEVTQHESVQHTAPLFARGQQRLADLKASQAAANVPQSKPDVPASEQKTAQLLQNRSTSLLDRILAKQAHTASLPVGPTREQLERKAALHRIEEVERILDLLTAGRPRCSFSMPVMAQQIQQSLRNPISKDEIERCLELMAAEITPGFVRLVRSGAVTGVVVTKAGKVGLQQLRQRVQSADA